MDEVAEDAWPVADNLGWESFTVIGHSVGGNAGQLMLLDAVAHPLDHRHLSGARIRLPGRKR
ncbi:hypothetical protein AB0D97_30065 [Streptomyces roseus]|uniref:hypothetical protein n=1 Tax=Streptomyces roseus TaxID=66430 RepID=UPI0033E71404